jgi:hypothetical protein
MAKNCIESESNVIFPVFQQSSNRQTDVFGVINSEICRNYTFYNDITQLKSLKTHSITALSSVCMIINLLKMHYQKIIEIDFENSENFFEKCKRVVVGVRRVFVYLVLSRSILNYSNTFREKRTFISAQIFDAKPFLRIEGNFAVLKLVIISCGRNFLRRCQYYQRCQYYWK